LASPLERPPSNRLARSVHDRRIAGVCGGIARWIGWDSTLVRILYIAISLASAAFPGILVYIILWVLMPEADD
jgi:phage shock protein C